MQNFFLGVLVTAFSLSLFAQEGETEASQMAVHVDLELDAETTEQELVERLTDEIHEAIEPKSVHRSGLRGFISAGIAKLNFGRTLLNSYRLQLMKNGDAQIGKHILNLVVLFSFSHFTEMLSGPSLLNYGSQHNWPGFVLTAIVIGGAIISMPGGVVDPFCIVCGVGYKKSKIFRGAVSAVRYAVLLPLDVALTVTGAKAVAKWLLPTKDTGDVLLEKMGLDREDYANTPIELVFPNAQGDPLLVLKFARENGRTIGLESLQYFVAKRDASFAQRLGGILKGYGFGINIGSAIEQSIKAIEKHGPVTEPVAWTRTCEKDDCHHNHTHHHHHHHEEFKPLKDIFMTGYQFDPESQSWSVQFDPKALPLFSAVTLRNPYGANPVFAPGVSWACSHLFK